MVFMARMEFLTIPETRYSSIRFMIEDPKGCRSCGRCWVPRVMLRHGKHEEYGNATCLYCFSTKPVRGAEHLRLQRYDPKGDCQ